MLAVLADRVTQAARRLTTTVPAMIRAARTPPIETGDKVAYANRFLERIGFATDGMRHARGVVTGIVRNGNATIAEIIWNTPELPAQVNVNHLSRV